MKFSKLNRFVHNWLSIIVVLPILLILITGILLVLKKDVDWIQPPTKKGQSIATPTLSMTDILAKVNATEQGRNLEWHEFERIEFKPSKGIVKFITSDLWEIQVDPTMGDILSVKKRRSDFIESLHDGSFFGSAMKYIMSLPSAIILLILCLTGLYMFFLPIVKKKSNKKKKARAVKVTP